MRGSVLLAMELALAGLILPGVVAMPPRLIWNASPSVPIGLYRLGPAGAPAVGERLVVRMPEPWAGLMAGRGYLPDGVLLIKPLAALPGQKICRFGHGVTIDGQLVALARARDRLGRPLPAWAGCKVLQADEVFLLSRARPDSFDGRYFGALPRAAVLGRARPIRTDERGDGRLVWFARVPSSSPSRPVSSSSSS